MTIEQQTGHGGEFTAGAPLVCESSDKFEERLAARTKVPFDRLTDYVALDEAKIRSETKTTARILKRFAQAVADTMEDSANADGFLQTLDLKAVSRDHDWRAIFAAIRDGEGVQDEHKQIVLIKYLQYLSFRKRLLEFVFVRKTGLEETDEIPVSMGESKTLNEPGVTRHSGSPKGRAREFRRLLLGEPIRFSLAKGETVEIMLAGHVFRLVAVNPPSLIDQNGVMYFLKLGRNMVGRHPEGDISVDPNFRDVSRAHAIVEWDGHLQIAVTDLSTKGTFVPLRAGKK
jgi:hypothetical protein